jgi:hypothetical protein
VVPSVAYCAGELNLQQVIWRLIKKETKTAQEYIQRKSNDVAKEKIFDESKSVSQIAYELGIQIPQHLRGCLNKGWGNRQMISKC